MPRRAPSPHPPDEPQRGDGVPVPGASASPGTGSPIFKAVSEVITALQGELELSERKNTERRELIVKLKEHFPDTSLPPPPKPKHPGRPIIRRNDGQEAYRARKRRNAAARRERLRAQAAAAAEDKPPQTDSDDVIQKAAAPEPQKPSKATEFQRWRERRNDTPVLDNSLVAS